MPLGLGQLTPDQLLELTIEVAQEWAQRDPYLRNMAQARINVEKERLLAQRSAMQSCAIQLVSEYLEGVRAESLAALREAFRTGEARILTSTQEARIVVDATLEAKIKIIDELVVFIQEGNLRNLHASSTKKKPAEARAADFPFKKP